MLNSQRRAIVSPLIAALIVAGAVVQAKAEPAPVSPLNPDIAEGDRLAHTLCVNCHVVDTQGPVIRTDRVPSFSWIANQDGLTVRSLTGWLSTSHERMPDFTLTRGEIRKVSAYILSLRK